MAPAGTRAREAGSRAPARFFPPAGADGLGVGRVIPPSLKVGHNFLVYRGFQTGGCCCRLRQDVRGIGPTKGCNRPRCYAGTVAGA